MILKLVCWAFFLALNSIYGVWSFTTPLKPSEPYTNRQIVTLDPSLFQIFWKRIGTDQIQFELHCRTLGWVGFGVSPDGTMRGADIAKGWVKNGVPFFFDMHAVTFGPPVVDSNQDLTRLASVEVDGYTIIKFLRKMDTGDRVHDIAIPNGSQIFIAAFNQEDPVTANGDWQYHGSNRWFFTMNMHS